ncbi:MAG: hypothetical protein ACE14S_07005 [Candidatus Bathyarchaeia archaeon]
MKKAIAILLIAAIAFSTLAFTASASAKPFMNWRMFQGIPGNPNRPINQNFVRVNGIITQWGTTNVTGTLQAQTRTLVFNSTTTRQGSTASAIWTLNTTRPLSTVRAKTNFTYTFYTAKLVDTGVTQLNTGGYDFFLSGNWTVFQMTTAFTVVTNTAGDVVSFHHDQDGVAMATRAYGELRVTGNWTSFTLAITGINPLTGTLRGQRIASSLFNSFKINDDSTNTVTPADLASVVKAYGSMPGWGNYDQRMDYNFDYKIDITDLATAAANVNL